MSYWGNPMGSNSTRVNLIVITYSNQIHARTEVKVALMGVNHWKKYICLSYHWHPCISHLPILVSVLSQRLQRIAWIHSPPPPAMSQCFSRHWFWIQSLFPHWRLNSLTDLKVKRIWIKRYEKRVSNGNRLSYIYKLLQIGTWNANCWGSYRGCTEQGYMPKIKNETKEQQTNYWHYQPWQQAEIREHKISTFLLRTMREHLQFL